MKPGRSQTRNSGYAGGDQLAQLFRIDIQAARFRMAATLSEQMDPDPVVLRFSPDEWNKLASGSVL